MVKVWSVLVEGENDGQSGAIRVTAKGMRHTARAAEERKEFTSWHMVRFRSRCNITLHELEGRRE